MGLKDRLVARAGGVVVAVVVVTCLRQSMCGSLLGVKGLLFRADSVQHTDTHAQLSRVFQGVKRAEEIQY
jgi:hypothetical protein